MKKFKKFLPLLILVLAAAVILVWSCLKTEEDTGIAYEHEGYIMGIHNTSEGTLLTLQNGNTKSEFLMTAATDETFNGEITQLQEGNYIKLNTTKNSDRNIKEFSAYSAFNMAGKIFYADNGDGPYLLIPAYGSYRVFALIPAQDSITVPQTGTEVKVYYQYPMNASTVNLVVDIIAPTSDAVTSLTEDEVDYITDKGYLISSEN